MVTETKDTPAPLLVRALRGERTERAPVWLMRQAGRTDPEYLAFRESCGISLHDLFLDPDAAVQISLLPKRIGVDAIIVFQDILTLLAPMGADFRFDPEPVLYEPLATPEALAGLRPLDPVEGMPHLAPLFRLVRDGAEGLPVLGFAGAPLTLLAFLVEGRGFLRGMPRLHALLREEPGAARRALALLADAVAACMRHQLDCGAAAVQLFESAAFCFTPEEYLDFALPAQQAVFDALRGHGTSIHFAHFPDTAPPLEWLGRAGADVLSLPSTVGIAEARRALGEGLAVQGNLDNRLLARGPWGEIEAAARACLDEGGARGHVFNLGHGLLRETPHEHVVNLVSLARSTVRA